MIPGLISGASDLTLAKTVSDDSVILTQYIWFSE